MKKKIIFFALALLLKTVAFSQNTNNSFTLNGKITGQAKGKVFLAYPTADGKGKRDSAIITNGAFVFKGMIAGPCEAYFEGNVKTRSVDDPNFTSFFIEPGTINIALKEGDFKHAIITGSKTQDEAKELEDSKAALYKAVKPWQDAYMKIGEEYRQAVAAKKPQAVIDSLNEKSAAVHDKLGEFSPQFEAIDYAFFASHPSSYVTATNLRFYTGRLTLDSMRMFYNNMNSNVQQSVYGKELSKQIEQLASGSPGAVAKNFTTNDIQGKSLSLANFKGKYVLLDFWASWCVPCRHSNPHLKELFAKYHDKGFDIIGVSDDDHDNAAWKKAVDKDGIGIWYHVLRGLDYNKVEKGLPNDEDISGKYGVHSLPTKILIDKNGVIIGRYDKATNEEQAEMDKKLAEVMGS